MVKKQNLLIICILLIPLILSASGCGNYQGSLIAEDVSSPEQKPQVISDVERCGEMLEENRVFYDQLLEENWAFCDKLLKESNFDSDDRVERIMDSCSKLLEEQRDYCDDRVARERASCLEIFG